MGCWIAAYAGLAMAGCTPGATPMRTASGLAQGTTSSLQGPGGADERAIEDAAERELARIDALLSTYRPDSTLERFNTTRSTEALELPAELVGLLELAKQVHDATDGCFDPTVRPLVRAWGFESDAPAVPTDAAMESARAVVGLDKLELLDATHVRKTVAELELDMSSIGQGYTAGRLAALLEQHGSTAYLAEIGGEVVSRGAKPGDAPWRIGVENPVDGAGPALRMPPDSRTAVITSGSYRHFFDADGRRFGHVIDPRTGWAVEHELLSVTVVGDDAATAAAWATALVCLGPRAAVEAAARENVAALLWTSSGETAVLEQSATFTSNWRDRLDAPAL